MALCAQLPGAASAVCGAAGLGASRLRMLSRRWKTASPIEMGIMRSRYEGSFSPTSSRRFVPLMLLPIGGYFACALHPCE
jgi:hypothetical protein